MDFIDSAMNPNVRDDDLFKPRIAVCGVGGGGSNTIQRLCGMGVRGASLIAVNTDAKHLNTMDQVVKRILVGGSITRGLGAGGFPEMGAKAAEISRGAIAGALEGYNLVFLTAGMGGGTGTGAAPVVADVAKKNGAVVVSIVTFPFALERNRLEVARRGIEELRKNSDTLIIIDNQKLVTLYPNLAIEQAFRAADEIAARAVRGISETITMPSLVNLDFADVKNIMTGGGVAMISVGEGHGTNKVDDVVRDTLKNKLLDVDFEGANGVLMHITGGPDMTLGDVNEIGRKLSDVAASNANVLWGARVDESYTDKVEVIAIFTGVKSQSITGRSEIEQPEDDLGLGRL
ncbi:MAG: cell division protein FtsZ [Candidatus Micrarchaeota archaeon]|nr:cell division protein FtsZ [Candidatus Micrarchaeota archaeon]